MQQLELGGAQLERLPHPGHTIGRGVQRQIAHGHRRRGLFWCAPAQHRTDAGKQLTGGKRLGNVVVGTDIETGHTIGLVAARREHQNRHRTRACVGSPFSGERQTALAGQHPVQQNHVGQHRIELPLGGFAVQRPRGLKAVVAQIHGDQLGDRRLVFHDQDTRQASHFTADSICSMAVWRTSVPLTM